MKLWKRKKLALSTNDCFVALEMGYILENEHKFTVRLVKGVQNKSNPRRFKRDYKFDYPTWLIVGRSNLWVRLQNLFYK